MVDPQEYQKRLQNIVREANAGNPDAMYALAVISANQSVETSMEWMQKAIDKGHVGAVYTLGAWYIQGTLLDQDLDKAHRLLTRASNMGFADADMMLAALHANGVGVERDWKTALSIILGQAEKGSARALCQLAFLCFMTAEKDAQPIGEMLLEAAAERLDILAMYAYSKRVLMETETGKEAEKAKGMIALAKHKGKHPCAETFPGIKGFLVPDRPPEPSFDLDCFDWAEIQNFFPKPPIPKRAEPKILKENPYIAAFPKFLTEEEADYMIGMSVRHLTPSQVVDPISGKHIRNEYRTSSDMRFWPTVQDLVIYSFLERISDASGEPVQNQEMLGVLKYLPGQQYKPHGDYLTADFSGKNPEVERSGQRKKTFLVYLNDDFSGGETEFINIDFKTRGKKGDGLMFVNITEAGEPNTLTVHAGRPVEKGVKWLSTMWIREKEYKKE